MQDGIKQKLREEENYQKVLDALVSVSSLGSYPINKAGFINSLAGQNNRKERIEKIESALQYFKENELIQINNDKIIVNKSALEYASKNLEIF